MIAVIANHWGTTVQNLIDKKLPVVQVFLPKATEINYNDVTVTNDQDLIFDRCRQLNVKLVALAGYTKKIVVPEDFNDKIVNIHPSLLPSFGGKGMYGINVHKKVIESGVKVTGCTVHFVNNEYDKGTILAQNPVPVKPDDTPEVLQERVKLEERKLYPSVIHLLLKDKIQNNQLIDTNLVRVMSKFVLQIKDPEKLVNFKGIWG